MNKAGRTILFLILAAVLLVSCGGGPPASPTPDMNAILTQSIGTLSASFFQTQTALVPPATNTPLPSPTPLPTNTPLALLPPPATATQAYFATAIVYPSVTGTVYTPTANPSSLAYGCNNLLLIRDVTISAGTEMSPGEKATKTWQVSNNGTCDWVYVYRLVPVSGAELASDSVKLNNKIEPGKWTQLSVTFNSPKDPGTYTQYWRLSDGAGNTFGSTLGISIVVKKPANTAVPPTATNTTAPTTYP